MTHRSPHRLWPLLLAAVLLVSCGSRKSKIPADWIARLAAAQGEVNVSPTSGSPLQLATPGLHLRVGARLETGPSSQAVLELRNGGRLTVQPSSIVQFTSDSPEHRLRVGLQSGSIIGKASNVVASELVIGLGARNIRLSASAAAEVKSEGATLQITYGQAEIEGPEGKRTAVEGELLSLTLPVKPDAGVTRPDAQTMVEAPALVYFLQASGKGRVMIRKPGERKFVVVRKGTPVPVAPGTEITLPKGASVMVGPEKGAGAVLSGPAEVKLVEGAAGADGKPVLSFESTGSNIQVSDSGAPGKTSAAFEAEGVRVKPRISYKRLDLRLRKERGRTTLSVVAGEAMLEDKKGKDQRIEAGQEAVLSKGTVSGPHNPPAASLELKSGGGMRVFTASPALPVTFRWTPGSKGALVEVSRSPSMDRPLFSDIIRRSMLTVRELPRGTHFWRVRKVDDDGKPHEDGVNGKLLLVRDTSHRSLKDRQAPKNAINESFGNTTVFYQNMLPRFTFGWESMGSGVTYQVKIFREQSLQKPIFMGETQSSELSVPGAKLGEGTFIWYVAGRERGKLVRTTKSRKLTIRYDNATPDLQIIYPANGLTVSEASLETNGVTIPGSKVSINGVRAELDETYRFTHSVKLKPGPNTIIYLVSDPRRGSSYYLRQVTRK